MLAEVIAKRTHCSGPLPPTTSSAPIPSPVSSGVNRRLTVERGAVDQAMAFLDHDIRAYNRVFLAEY